MDHLELVNNFIESLPSLDKDRLPEGDLCCPICLVSFEDILKDGSAEILSTGVTQLPTCGHIFCRKDLVEWIRNMHGNCPSCRRVFLDIRPPSDSDGESSDGGEYIPNEEDEDEDDSFMFDTDGFSEADGLDVEMDVDLAMYQDWDTGYVDDVVDDGSSEWGLTDGESYSNSDSLESEAISLHSADANIVIQQDMNDEDLSVESNGEDK